ncbi:MAG: dihydropteroate synthase [Bacteroidia bacterium]|nr:dihydropteroate synthase [Bacteroidia bacterium]
MNTKSSEIKSIAYSCNGKTLTFIKPLIMAIVNITPDSFYDGGKFGSSHDVLRDVEEKVKQGADIIDLGAASSRPNAVEISEEEEWKRLETILVEVRKEFPKVFISVDTYRASIAKKSAEHGADIINDISGGNLDFNMFDTVAKLDLPYVLMHMLGTPQTMQKQAAMKNALETIKSEFKLRIDFLEKKGFRKIILDPGFGFGKSVENNYQLLKELSAFQDLNFPVLAGISRKSMINKVIGTNPVTALNGTTVLNTLALLNGASILRVHDVNESKQAIELVEYYKNV